PSVAPRDSTPSAEALAVLKTIPDPVAGGSPQPAAASPAGAPAPSATAAPADSSGAAPDTAGADVPIPALTQPLGDRPGARAAPAWARVGGPPATASAPQAGEGAAAPPDSCWRVQVVAVPEAARSASLRDAAQSQLWTTMVIETEKKLHKIRT